MSENPAPEEAPNENAEGQAAQDTPEGAEGSSESLQDAEGVSVASDTAVLATPSGQQLVSAISTDELAKVQDTEAAIAQQAVEERPAEAQPGVRIGQWANQPNYECTFCDHSTPSLQRAVDHLAVHPQEMRQATAVAADEKTNQEDQS